MQRLTLNQSFQPLLFKLRQLGWQAHVGMVLIALAALLFATLVLPKQENLTEFHRHIFELKTAGNKLKKNEVQDSHVDLTQRFYAVLPAQAEVNTHISQILHTVHAIGLVSNKAEFSQIVVPESALVKYQIKLPVLGSYMHTRQFINSIFNQFPSIALSNISLSRNDINNDAVASNIELLLYVRKSK